MVGCGAGGKLIPLQADLRALARGEMDTSEREHLVATWIKHHKDTRATGKIPNETFWAWETVDNLCRRQPDVAWEIILQILETDHSGVILENLSAGPLEDLLAKHGLEVIARVEEQARRDPLFRLLLGGAWKNVMQEDVWARVQQARGEVW